MVRLDLRCKCGIIVTYQGEHMSEGQGKPNGVWSDLRPFVLFFVFAIVIFAVLILISNSGWQESPQKPAAYMTAQEQIQPAVTFYAENHNQSLPILNVTYTNANCSNCHVLDISALLAANGGLMREAPYCLNLSASGNDNCGGNASLGCRNGSSYIWIVNSIGDVYSYCAGAGCKTNNSGYQGVWP